MDSAKTQIFYPRTYRRYARNSVLQWQFIFFFAVPMLLLLLFFYPLITRQLSEFVSKSLNLVMPGHAISIQSSEYIPFFGDVYFVSAMPTVYPSFPFVLLCLMVTLCLLAICMNKKYKNGPIAIYLSMNLLIFLVSCIYFALAPHEFPYTATAYSELYLKQQVGIWIFFMTIAGLVLGFLSNHGLGLRVLTFLAIMLYSFVYGCVRYLTFLLLIHFGSVLFMPMLFFTLGPFFDFIYLVYIYSAFAGRVIEKAGNREGRGAWEWL